MFGKHWKPARGTVVATRIASTTGDGMVSISEFVVDVRTPEGEVFRAKLEEPRIAIDFKPPSVGVEIAVDYDPKSHDVRFDKDDPTISWKAYKKQRLDTFEATLAEPPGSPAVSPFGSAVTPDAPGMAQIRELFQSASAQGGVVRLDSNNPEVAKLKEFLLGAAAQQAGQAPVPTDRPDRPASADE
jgi:hypothetical protein